jgi:hypothetical protein
MAERFQQRLGSSPFPFGLGKAAQEFRSILAADSVSGKWVPLPSPPSEGQLAQVLAMVAEGKAELEPFEPDSAPWGEKCQGNDPPDSKVETLKERGVPEWALGVRMRGPDGVEALAKGLESSEGLEQNAEALKNMQGAPKQGLEGLENLQGDSQGLKGVYDAADGAQARASETGEVAKGLKLTPKQGLEGSGGGNRGGVASERASEAGEKAGEPHAVTVSASKDTGKASKDTGKASKDTGKASEDAVKASKGAARACEGGGKRVREGEEVLAGLPGETEARAAKRSRRASKPSEGAQEGVTVTSQEPTGQGGGKKKGSAGGSQEEIEAMGTPGEAARKDKRPLEGEKDGTPLSKKLRVQPPLVETGPCKEGAPSVKTGPSTERGTSATETGPRSEKAPSGKPSPQPQKRGPERLSNAPISADVTNSTPDASTQAGGVPQPEEGSRRPADGAVQASDLESAFELCCGVWCSNDVTVTSGRPRLDRGTLRRVLEAVRAAREAGLTSDDISEVLTEGGGDSHPQGAAEREPVEGGGNGLRGEATDYVDALEMFELVKRVRLLLFRLRSFWVPSSLSVRCCMLTSS